MTAMRLIATISGAALLSLSLQACTWDYAQHTDRVGYSAGDAVKANLESQTINPTKASMYKKTGLGKNGNVIPAGETASAGGATTPSP